VEQSPIHHLKVPAFFLLAFSTEAPDVKKNEAPEVLQANVDLQRLGPGERGASISESHDIHDGPPRAQSQAN
jgi:hypothetical protein